MILNCAIIDEDPEALQLLEQYIEKTPTLHLIGAYKSAIDAVDGIHHNHLDILFSPSTCSKSAVWNWQRLYPRT